MTVVEPIDSREFRSVVGKFATGVTVMTTYDDSYLPTGVTVNSFSSLSLLPPFVMWCLANRAYSRSTFETAEYWAVHILSRKQAALSSRFAAAGTDKFDGVQLQPNSYEIPLLADCAAHLVCQTHSVYPGGDHIILIGE